MLLAPILHRNSDVEPAPSPTNSSHAPLFRRDHTVDAHKALPLYCEASKDDAGLTETKTPAANEHVAAADTSTWGYCTMRGFYLSEMNRHLQELINAKPTDDGRVAALQRVAQAACDYSWCYDRVAPELPPRPPNDRYRPTSPLRSISHKDLHDRVCKAVQDIWEVAYHAATAATASVTDLMVPLAVSRAGCLQSLDAEYQWRMYGEDASLDAALEGTMRKLRVTCCNNFAGLCTSDRFKTRLMQTSHL